MQTKVLHAPLLGYALLLALFLLPASCSKKSSKSSKTTGGAAAKTSSGSSGDRGSEAPSSTGGSKVVRGNKTPKRALPRLAKSAEDAARAAVRDAKTEYNSALKANNASPPDKTAFFAALNSCKKKLDEADEHLEPVMTWEEESTMESWRVTADDDAYLRSITRIFSKIDKLRAAAEKISRAR